jgi:hypothetical protein
MLSNESNKEIEMKKLLIFLALIPVALVTISGQSALADDYCEPFQRPRNLEAIFFDGTTFSEEDAYAGVDCGNWPGIVLNSHTVYVPANSTLRLDDYLVGIRINSLSGSTMVRQTFPICYSIQDPVTNECPYDGCVMYTSPNQECFSLFQLCIQYD